jgi:hypothetical protein
MESRPTLEQLKTQARRHLNNTLQLRLDFVATELSITMTFISLARTALKMGHAQSGQRLQEKAATACAEAEKQINQSADQGANVTHLRKQLREARSALEHLRF